MTTFTNGKYESDSGDIHPIRLDPLRYAQAGTEPTGNINNDIKVKVSKTDREFGIRPRGVTLAREIGTAPDTFKKYSFLPILLASEFGNTSFAIGATITIDGVAWEVIAKKAEDY